MTRPVESLAQEELVAVALARQSRTARELAEDLKLNPKSAARACSRLKEGGRVKPVGTKGKSTVWGLKDDR